MFAVILIFKNGISLNRTLIIDAFIPAIQSFPSPSNFFSGSVYIATAKLLNATTWQRIAALDFLQYALALTLIINLAIRSTKKSSRYLFLVLLISTTTFQYQLHCLGTGQSLLLLGQTLFVLGYDSWLVFCGALLMYSAHCEQALLSTFALFTLSGVKGFEKYRIKCQQSLVLGLVVEVVIQLWFISNKYYGSRLGVIPYFLGLSLQRFLIDPALNIWSWLGLGWLLVLIVIWSYRKLPSNAFLVLLSLVLLPGFFTLITADGARVFGAISYPSMVALILWFTSGYISSQKFMNYFCSFYTISFAIFPNGLGGWGSLGVQLYSLLSPAFEALSTFSIQLKDSL